MKHQRREPKSEEVQQLGAKAAACFLGGFVVFVLGFMRGSALSLLLSRFEAPLSSLFHTEVNAPLIAIGIAIVWMSVGIIFWGRAGDIKTQAQKVAERDEKMRENCQQQQDFEAELKWLQQHDPEL